MGILYLALRISLEEAGKHTGSKWLLVPMVQCSQIALMAVGASWG